jgi:uncharacterized protein
MACDNTERHTCIGHKQSLWLQTYHSVLESMSNIMFHARRKSVTICVLFLLFSAPVTASTPTLSIPLQIGMYIVQAEVADDTQTRAKGLMFRTEMNANQGMLFIFERLSVQCFWMKNTLIPLTAAFIDDQGKIVNMADMTPLTESSHCSKQPVRYVLEMNQGWFATRGIKEGQVIKGIR